VLPEDAAAPGPEVSGGVLVLPVEQVGQVVHREVPQVKRLNPVDA